MTIAYLNGQFLPESEAFVPALDRGFIFGDAVYELVPIYNGKALAMDAHAERLSRSLKALAIDESKALPNGLAPLCEELVARNGGGDLALYLQITRGVAPRDHAPSGPMTPTVFGRVSPMARTPAGPVSAITAPDIRWGRCDIKATALLANVLARMEAQQAGAFEAILLRDGLVTEGAASNVFAVFAGTVVTPPEGPQMLSGVTRALLLEQLARTGIPHEVRPLRDHELTQADELWVTSSSKAVVPVVSLDGRPVGAGEPGPLWQRVVTDYFAALP